MSGASSTSTLYNLIILILLSSYYWPALCYNKSMTKRTIKVKGPISVKKINELIDAGFIVIIA